MRRIELGRCDLTEILEAVTTVRVCLLGDVCLDAYWHADMRRSVLSRETPRFPLPVTEERYSLGGAGNVAAGIALLGPKRLRVISLIGDDWRGYEMKRCFDRLGLSSDRLFTGAGRVTPAYCKPMRHGHSQEVQEDARLDFENIAFPDAADEERVLSALRGAAKESDILVVSDQLAGGVVSPRVREELARLGAQGMVVVVDSRQRAGEYRQVLLKPNELEAAAAVGAALPEGGPEAFADIAAQLAARTGMPVLMTLGERGALWRDGEEFVFAPARRAEPPIDVVGAGDEYLAAFACAYGAGVDGPRAAAFANLAAAVTVKKLGTTGNATPGEILEKYEELRHE